MTEPSNLWRLPATPEPAVMVLKGKMLEEFSLTLLTPKLINVLASPETVET